MKLLQQGRGAGFLAAVDAGKRASADLLDCVLHDPRWDRQVESRDDYYAQLLLATDTNIDAVHRFILEEGREADDADFWLPIGVLAEMSRRGSASANDAMAEAVTTGAQWRSCLDALDAAGGLDLVRQVVSVEAVKTLMSRVGVNEIADAVELVAAPWESWAEQVPALRFVISGNKSGRALEPRRLSGNVAWAASRLLKPEIPDDLAALTTESLLLLSATSGAASEVAKELARRTDPKSLRLLVTAVELGTPGERNVALRALGRQGSTEFVAAAEEFLRRASTLALTEGRENQRRIGFVRYLEELPPAVSLPLARTWFFEAWPLALAAQHILARHAASDDRPMLEAAGAAALESSDMYRLCSVVDALATAGPDDSLPFLAEVYEQAPYSWARRRVVGAMGRCHITGAADRYLEEALWDCEPESRKLACRAIGKSTNFPLARIRELASDPYEEDFVGEAARGALERK
ncbi:MAG: hypothetical protein ABI639_01280 [Thermoanaerobaculia bacterium]